MNSYIIYFILSILFFVMVSVVENTEHFSESNDVKTKSISARIEENKSRIQANIIKIKENASNISGLTTNINSSFSRFANFFTRMNEEPADDFQTSALILFDRDFLKMNKDKIKDILINNLSKDTEDDEISYKNVTMIAFIFAKHLINPLDNASTNTLGSNLILIENEISDFFNLRYNESLVNDTYEYMRKKNSSYLIDKLNAFVYKHLYKNQKNLVDIKSLDKLRDEWVQCFPNHINYTDFERKIKSKIGSFVELIEETND